MTWADKVRAAAARGTVGRQRQGLGTWLEQQLRQLGITEARYIEVKQRFGLPPKCGCAGRKEWLDNVTAWWHREG